MGRREQALSEQLNKLSPAGGGGGPGKGEDRTGEEVETEEVGKEEEAPGEAVLLVQEFLWAPPLPSVCRFMLSKAFAWTELPSRAAGAQEPSAVGRCQAGRGSCFHLDTKTHTGTRPYALSSSD